MCLQIDSACNHSGGPVVGGRAQPRAPCARLVRKKLEPGVCAHASFDVSVPPTVTATQAEGVVGKKKCVKSNQGGGRPVLQLRDAQDVSAELRGSELPSW